ncbi:protein of unknown function [Mesotoga infera]|uniref:Uncharacterized protein n=1 Tax=Mesotoga infera TaxID=1236046 RepID=A0A7Z7LI16_9BACT|nr:protein of unknown function [Mesotoga infera]
MRQLHLYQFDYSLFFLHSPRTRLPFANISIYICQFTFRSPTLASIFDSRSRRYENEPVLATQLAQTEVFSINMQYMIADGTHYIS